MILFVFSCIAFIIAYGFCRKWLLESNKSRYTAKSYHHVNSTYLDTSDTTAGDPLDPDQERNARPTPPEGWFSGYIPGYRLSGYNRCGVGGALVLENGGKGSRSLPVQPTVEAHAAGRSNL